MTERPRPNALSWLWLTLGLIVADQLTKWWALVALQPAETPHPVIPGILNWTLTFNTGAAFSFLADSAGWQRWFFAALAVGISAVLAVWLSRTPRRDWRTAVPLAMIISGALGNLIDRVYAAKVTDFIQVYLGSYPFPVFNVADCAISVGAAGLIVFSLFQPKAR
ncbi:signal peptidase II [Luteibacter aegosomaticola]|uniref:signal peptidase II n=1 Tax=Luteibacter aegosomaticola TaxID=2911538 RepID=UPI001FF8F4BB|nr:signal peptidase II [Luteibacter aegosomaticola]UPG88894.1 signal peptidase II [Luteibacter aegosomaticola]